MDFLWDTMKTSPAPRRQLRKDSLPSELDRFLRTATKGGFGSSPTAYLEQGAELVTPAALETLAALLPELRRKTLAIKDSARLRERLTTLITYFAGTGDEENGDPVARAEIGFVLIYFLKGYDVIPDSLPHIGLVDDALLVEAVLGRHQEAIRSHAQLLRRNNPENW